MDTSNTSTNPTPQENLQTSDLMGAISSKLLNQSGIVSSTASTLDQRLGEAIAGVSRATSLSNQRVESEFGRELGYTMDKAQQDLTAGRSAGSGGVLNMGALRALTETTDKSLKDLDQRKQELILANDAAGASKIAELQFKQLEFQQAAQQQVFSNLLSMGNFTIQQASEERLRKQQSFAEQQATSSIALEYGLTLKPGETLEQVVSRAAPFASKEQQLRLAKMTSEVAANNAQVRKYLSEGATIVDANNLDVVANAALINPAVLSTIKDFDQLSKVVVKVNELKKSSISSQIDNKIARGEYKNKQAALSDIQSSITAGTIDPVNAEYAINYINNNFSAPASKNGLTQVRQIGGLTGGGTSGLTVKEIQKREEAARKAEQATVNFDLEKQLKLLTQKKR